MEQAMPFATISKPPPSGVSPRLADYEGACRDFSWVAARAMLSGLPGGGLNIAYEAVDRHVRAGMGSKLALRWIGKDDRIQDFSYEGLRRATNRFANLLVRLGLKPGERVFTLLGRQPALYIAALGSVKAGCVFSPLFSAFGPEPVEARLSKGDGRVLVTTEPHYRKKVAPIRDRLPGLRHIVLVGERTEAVSGGSLDFDAALAVESEDFAIVPTRPDDIALLHFTSGTTGKPKGALHVHEAVVAHHATGQYALDFHGDDIFWCTADPGWVTGTSYGIISPLTNGLTMIVDEAEFDALRWFRILQEQKVTVWYTAPTAIRMLMRLGPKPAEGFDLSRLRFLSSVGEPLNPEAVVWSLGAFGRPFHDNWWQTETGGIMIANYAAMNIKPGSMGRPLPGIEAAIVERAGDGELREVTAPDTLGELALKRGWPSMFRGYLGETERYEKCFVGDWYLSGDLATRDKDGYFWFVGRSDDVIKSAGHLIGPFEVESALMEHPAVVEAAVIGKPDPIIGESVKAFVVLKQGHEDSVALRKELLGFARIRLGAAVAPREIDIKAGLPRTRSGKIMRRLLKARELGLPEGDLSTLESDTR
ncbi:acetate--CoA ligase [Hypericibacter terrae]|uniref:acetate--CoA ligase n=2 Tax=Hypericibacter terrae TaxID=2602015 RepID=A0A5J6MG73_9PROT|nr:acetate--CoA ligase [Hypericibacter terrae]